MNTPLTELSPFAAISEFAADANGSIFHMIFSFTIRKNR